MTTPLPNKLCSWHREATEKKDDQGELREQYRVRNRDIRINNEQLLNMTSFSSIKIYQWLIKSGLPYLQNNDYLVVREDVFTDEHGRAVDSRIQTIILSCWLTPPHLISRLFFEPIKWYNFASLMFWAYRVIRKTSCERNGPIRKTSGLWASHKPTPVP